MNVKEFYTNVARERNRQIGKARAAIDSSNKDAKLDAEMRIRFLIRLRGFVDTVWPPPSQSVFISYSTTTGSDYYRIAEQIARDYGFRVITGFQDNEKSNVLRAVIEAIRDSAVFLSIMTPEMWIRSRSIDAGWEDRTSPNAWLIEEKGMALALGKPFRLLVEESVHPDFWKRTTPEKLHTIFKAHTFSERAEEAIRALLIRWEELILTCPYSSDKPGDTLYDSGA
jgi:hypothetical protein